MCKQMSFGFDQVAIERIAKRFSEKRIYRILHKGWISEYVADHSIKLRRKYNG